MTVDPTLCKGCLICVRFCSWFGAGVLRAGPEETELGGRIPELAGECVGCGWCERACPDFAIWVEVT